jgi:hypothetical protein
MLRHSRRLFSFISFLLIFFAGSMTASISEARDPHPRKVRVKNGSGEITWGTPLVYGSLYGKRLIDVVGQNQYCSPNGWKCDCFFKPEGPMDTWVKIDRAPNAQYGDQCYAPPYTTSGPWWDWLAGQIQNQRNALESKFQEIVGISVSFGIDGEARPLKCDDGWRRAGGGSDASMEGQFNSLYVPAVVAKVLQLYPGKTIRAQTDPEFQNLFLENGIDFHRESLASDEVHAYLYEGLQWTGMGWWQGFADRFWVTNTLGLVKDGLPFIFPL